MTSLFINWHVNPDIFSIGSFAIRWYGLFFVLSFYFGYLILNHIFKKEGHKTELLDKLTMYMLIATIVGARLGHCFFYQPDIYLKDPLEILKVWHGGLASHGAAIGILLGIWLFVRKNKEVSYMWVVDRIVIVVALAGFFIRMGNLMNSEIVGKASDMKGAFVFQRNDQHFPSFYGLWNSGNIEIKWKKVTDNVALYEVEKSYDLWKWEKVGQVKVSDTNRTQSSFHLTDKNIKSNHLWYRLKANESLVTLQDLLYRNCGNPVYSERYPAIVEFIPRHPTQIYEAFSYLLLFIFLLLLYFRKGMKLPGGYIFGLFLIILFSIRFLIEFFKEVQVDFERHLSLNMGQLLSLPFILIGIVLMIWVTRKKVGQE